MDAPKSWEKTGKFFLPSGKQVNGELTLDGSQTILHLYDEEPLGFLGKPEYTLQGRLRDLTMVSLLNCTLVQEGSTSNFKNDSKGYSAKLFPAFVIYGDRHLLAEDKVIERLDFIVDDAAALFYRWDTYGHASGQTLVDEIVKTLSHDKTVETGPDGHVFYFAGKTEIFSTDTAIGGVSASHGQHFSVGSAGI
jgi:hypothetical protein